MIEDEPGGTPDGADEEPHPSDKRQTARPAAHGGSDTPVSTNRRRLVTDGGQGVDDDHQEASPGSESFDGDDRDADPFLWQGDDASSDDDDDDGEAEESSQRTAVRKPRSDAERGSVNGQPDEVGSLDEGLDAVETRLRRLESVAEDLNIAAINAGLKHARGEEADLETIHDEVETYAERVDVEVDRLGDLLESLRSVSEEVTEGHAGAAGQLLDSPTPSVTVRAGWERPRDATDPDDAPVVDVEKEMRNGTTPPTKPAVDPVDFLIPGAELRDMWRARMRNDHGSIRPRGERWILETTPREDDASGSLEFPAEVTEFTLDPDELSFSDVLDLVDVDSDDD